MFSIGSIVYCLDIDTGLITKCKVLASENTYYKVEAISHIEMDGFESFKCCGTYIKLPSEVFETYIEAYQSLNSTYNKNLSMYKKSIKDLKSLIEFPLHHVLCGENMDKAARDAYIESCKRIFNN